MREVLFNLLRLEPQNEVLEMRLVALGVWVAVVVLSLTSVYALPKRLWVKLGWALAIVALPLVGLSAYCIYALCVMDYGAFLGFLALRQGGNRTENPRRAEASLPGG